MSSNAITNLQKKIIIISLVNTISLALDLGMTYYISNLQITRKKADYYKNTRLQSILNSIKPACYTLGTIGDGFYLSYDGFVDESDVESYTTNWQYLLLHIAKSGVRIAEYVNTLP